MAKKEVKVAAAVIRNGDKYLCMQRRRSHREYESERWEFPGGKVEDGESGYDTLLREIKEEMDWDIYVGRTFATITHDYPDFTLSLTAYLCKPGDGDFTMLEHLDSKWLDKEELSSLRWTDADKKIVAIIQEKM